MKLAQPILHLNEKSLKWRKRYKKKLIKSVVLIWNGSTRVVIDISSSLKLHDVLF